MKKQNGGWHPRVVYGSIYMCAICRGSNLGYFRQVAHVAWDGHPIFLSHFNGGLDRCPLWEGRTKETRAAVSYMCLTRSRGLRHPRAWEPPLCRPLQVIYPLLLRLDGNTGGELPRLRRNDKELWRQLLLNFGGIPLWSRPNNGAEAAPRRQQSLF